MKTTIDIASGATQKNPHLHRMVAELSTYMTPMEVDSAVDLLNTLATSNFDINMSVDDSSLQLKLLLGSERYLHIKEMWTESNQRLLSETPGISMKFQRLSDGTLWDGLDSSDDPRDYRVVYR